MKLVVNNKAKNEAKKIMESLMVCIKDKKLSIQERNNYYKEYLQIASNYLLLSK